MSCDARWQKCWWCREGALQKLWLEIGRFAIALSANQHSISEITKIQYFVPAFGISGMTSTHCTGSTCAADKEHIVICRVYGYLVISLLDLRCGFRWNELVKLWVDIPKTTFWEYLYGLHNSFLAERWAQKWNKYILNVANALRNYDCTS